MKRNPLVLFGLFALGIVASARGDAAPSLVNPVAIPAVGTHIDARNVARYGNLIPAALRFAIDHGLRVNVVRDHPIKWPAPYERDTEQFASQVSLSANGTIQNYTGSSVSSHR